MLGPDDRKKFSFDVCAIDWSSYLENYVLGIRKHIFGESDCTIPKARQMLLWYVLILYSYSINCASLVFLYEVLILLCFFTRYKWVHRMTRFALVIFILKIGVGKNAANFVLEIVNKCLLLREELIY